MYIVRNRKIFFIISTVLLLGSLASIAIWGLRFGIDFKGGSLVEVAYPDGRPDAEELRQGLDPLALGTYTLQPTGETGYILRTNTLSETDRVAVVSVLSDGGAKNMEQKRFDTIGPTIGAESSRKALLSIGLVVLLIVIFIAFAFRKVSEPVASWKYGLIAVVALLHDVLIPAGAFAILGHYAGFEVDTLFVTALLVILGFSIHDTIVVFDRVRENLKNDHEQRTKKPFAEIVGDSLSQTITRSINTSMTVLITLLALYVVGGESIKHFVLALIIGIIAGTYSSIFIASPLLVTVEGFQSKKNS